MRRARWFGGWHIARCAVENIACATTATHQKKPGELEIDRFTARQKSLLTTDKQVSDEGN